MKRAHLIIRKIKNTVTYSFLRKLLDRNDSEHEVGCLIEAGDCPAKIDSESLIPAQRETRGASCRTQYMR